MNRKFAYSNKLEILIRYAEEVREVWPFQLSIECADLEDGVLEQKEGPRVQHPYCWCGVENLTHGLIQWTPVPIWQFKCGFGEPIRVEVIEWVVFGPKFFHLNAI